MKRFAADSALYGSSRQAQLRQLPPRHNPVLLLREIAYHGIHTGQFQ
jgi:hypothetical protein